MIPEALGADQPQARDRDVVLEADLAMLLGLGWDPDSQVFRPDPGHPLLGYRVCAVAGCGNEASSRERLCTACARHRADDPSEELDSFISRKTPGPNRRQAERLCLVCRMPGTSRPAGPNGLCFSCDHRRRMRNQSVEAFISGDPDHAPAQPRPTIGVCTVIACERLAARVASGLCDAHDQLWRAEGRPELARFATWAGPCQGDRGGVVVLRGLPERVVAEFLYGIQANLEDGRRLPLTVLRTAADHLRHAGVQGRRSGRHHHSAPAGAALL